MIKFCFFVGAVVIGAFAGYIICQDPSKEMNAITLGAIVGAVFAAFTIGKSMR
jgi:hypothetical protein